MSELDARREGFARLWRELRRAMDIELGVASPRGVALPLVVAAALGLALGWSARGASRRRGSGDAPASFRPPAGA